MQVKKSRFTECYYLGNHGQRIIQSDTIVCCCGGRINHLINKGQIANVWS